MPTTRTLTNAGAPLHSPEGDLLGGVQIHFQLMDIGGRPSDAWDAISNERVGGETVIVTTDAAGEFSVDLWPNTRGNRETKYKCRVQFEGFREFSGVIEDVPGELQWAEFMLAGSSMEPQDMSAIAAAITSHINAADPHTQYAKESDLGNAAGLDVGTTAGTVAAGDDARLSDSRPPTGAAGGVLSGSYPNPGFAVDIATQAELDAVASGVYFVEEFRASGDTDSQVVNKALRAIELAALPGAVLRFEAGRTYVYDSSHSLGLINDLDIDLNGSLLKRAAASVNTALLTAELSTAVPAGLTLYVDQIPQSWAVGDLVAAVVGLSNTEVSTPRRITAIDAALKKITLNYALDGYTGVNPYPIGTTIVKSWSCFVGRPSATDSSSLLPEGANKRIRIHGGTIDGNRAEQVNRSWRYTTEIMLHSEGGAIYDCTFKETAGECLVGHGYIVRDNVFVDLGGSAMHTSVHDNTMAVATPLVFTGNTVRRTNLYTQAVNGHSEGAFTFSWGAGHAIISNNLFDGGSEYVLGGFGPSSGANADRLLIFSGNICKGYKGIFHSLNASTYGVIVTGNDFHDCGDNRTILASLKAPDNRISDNSASGDTLLAENVPLPTQLNPVEILPAGNIPSVLGVGNMLRVRRTLSGVSSASHDNATFIVEHSNTNIFAMSCGGAGYSGVIFYAAGQTGFGSASLSYTPSTSKLAIGTNTAGATVGIITGSNLPAMRFLSDGSAVFDQRSKAVCIGDPATDGSWAIDASGTDLIFKRRVAGAWVTKSTVTG